MGDSFPHAAVGWHVPCCTCRFLCTLGLRTLGLRTLGLRTVGLRTLGLRAVEGDPRPGRDELAAQAALRGF